MDAEQQREQGSVAARVAATMRRAYERQLTTLSGGNVSRRAADGTVWITPGGRPKDAIRSDDVVAIAPDGAVRGQHGASSETPMHRAIYDRRADVGAVVHAHPPFLIGYSAARRLPEVAALPAAQAATGRVVMVPYALTGSSRLGELLGEAFAGGADVAVLENHGVVTAGVDLREAFRRLETLETAARILATARGLVTPAPSSATPPDTSRASIAALRAPAAAAADRRTAAAALRALVARAGRRKLLIGTMASASIRVGTSELLLTPECFDFEDLADDDLIALPIESAADAPVAARHLALHRAQPDVQVVVEAAPPHATAFSLAGAPISTRTIPECVMLLGDSIPILPPDAGTRLAGTLSLAHPAALVARYGAAVVGASPDDALDRLEVLESAAQTAAITAALGGAELLSESALAELAAAMRSRG